MINFILFIIALLLFAFLAIIGFVYAVVKNFFAGLSQYFWLCALSLDQTGNTFCQMLFNDVLIKKNGHKFGNPDQTVSYVLGINLKQETISTTGKIIAAILNFIDKNHVQKAAQNPQ